MLLQRQIRLQMARKESMRISILDSKLRYGQRLWIVGSTLTWTLPQDMLFGQEKDKKTSRDGNVSGGYE